MTIVPVVIGALGVVKKGIKKHNDKNYQKKLTTQNCKRSPPRIKPHPQKSSIDRMKSMTTH